MREIVRKTENFIKKETVLCAAVVLALISAFIVPPGREYISYIDWDTMALLFSLMVVMKGLQKAGLFTYTGNLLLKRITGTRSLMLILVFLPFVFSMAVTNDVALITFVPFSMTVLRMADCERLTVPVTVMQTVAANMGSSLTPMGNPQNLYLYGRSGMSVWELFALMFPYVLISAVCLAFYTVLRRPVPVSCAPEKQRPLPPKRLLCCGAGFVLCVLGIFGLIPPIAVAAAAGLFALAADRKTLAEVDYSLLATFAAFFIFIGNVGNMDGFRTFFAGLIEGRTEIVAVLASQAISNVPAALLLSGFTDRWDELIIGCNLGGLGTLIASMASLISYKALAKEYPEKRKRYLAEFTLFNVGLLAVLLALGAFI